MVLNFPKTKTKCMHFCQSRKLQFDPDFTLDDVHIEVAPEFKFIGLLFDSKLSLIPHINYLCKKALNLFKLSLAWTGELTEKFY